MKRDALVGMTQVEPIPGEVPAQDAARSPLLQRFDPVDLAGVGTVAMGNRTDTKFILPERQMWAALETLTEHYWILDIQGVRLSSYRTLYFDTARFSLYLRQHAGGRNTYKVRSRNYVATNRSFVEVKRKDELRTAKQRMPTEYFVTSLAGQTSSFVDEHVPVGIQGLNPTLWNSFDRISLLSKDRPERLTLDLNLTFRGTHRSVTLPGLAIAELKQESAGRDSEFLRQMKAWGVRPTGFSKYCLGLAMVHPELKQNRFRPKLKAIQKLMRGVHAGE
jgi:hypothetical protein